MADEGQAARGSHASPAVGGGGVHALVLDVAEGGQAVLGPAAVCVDEGALPRTEAVVLQGGEGDVVDFFNHGGHGRGSGALGGAPVRHAARRWAGRGQQGMSSRVMPAGMGSMLSS